MAQEYEYQPRNVNFVNRDKLLLKLYHKFNELIAEFKETSNFDYQGMADGLDVAISLVEDMELDESNEAYRHKAMELLCEKRQRVDMCKQDCTGGMCAAVIIEVDNEVI